MALQMLYVHWKTVRWGLLPFVILAFGLPLLSVQGVGAALAESGATNAGSVLGAAQMWQGGFPLIAGSVGALLALSAWTWDHRVGHVYALSLPVARERYAFLKFAGGAALALIPVAALLLGSFVAMASLDLPAGLNAYPLQLASRFLFGSLVVYGFFFALASGTVRTAVIALSLIIGVPFLATASIDLLGGAFPELAALDVGRWIDQALMNGPFRVFFGPWMLIDV